MLIMLDEQVLRSMPLHDAEIHLLKMTWTDDGFTQVQFRVEINPEEDIMSLLKIGINSYVLDIFFENVWLFQSSILSYSIPKEVVLDWEVIQPSPLIGEIKAQGMAQSIPLYHQKIVFSGGSIMDIVFENAKMKQATEIILGQ